MVFKRCCVGGQDYSHASTSGAAGRAVIPVNSGLLARLGDPAVEQFLTLLAVCNTVIVATPPPAATPPASPAPGGGTPGRGSCSTPPTRSISPSPPPSLTSTASSTAGLTAPARRRPRPRYLPFLPAAGRPLSPITPR